MVILQEKINYQRKRFSSEKIPVIEVDSVDEFGHYLALDLLFWIDKNPAGVISLPTGRTPESFIRALEWYKKNWLSDAAQKNIKEWGLNLFCFPQTHHIRLIQMDEFLWMTPENPQSYAAYLQSYYVNILNIPQENCLFMDFNKMGFDLNYIKKIMREQPNYEFFMQNDYVKKALESINVFCKKYEEKISEWGGIGYFLGGIGLDGHVAFNVSGSLSNSITRIVKLNLKSKIGFKKSDQQFDYAITIGLKTIMQNQNCSIVLAAIGREKADIVQKAIEESITSTIPASYFQQHPQTRFILTQNSASRLCMRNKESFDFLTKSSIANLILDQVIIQMALRLKKKIVDIVPEDFTSEIELKLFEKIKYDLADVLNKVVSRIKNKIDRGLQSWEDKKVLHTAPHHDDVMLGYYSLIVRNKNAYHHMAYLVSGSNGVSDPYLYEYLKKNKKDSNLIVWYEQQGNFKDNDQAILEKMNIREQEDESLWKDLEIKYEISHLRSPFYNASYFKSEPTYEGDIAPCLELIKKFSPDVIFILHDAEFEGPSTHHISWNVIINALKEYEKPIELWGYRNVWSCYKIDEAEMIAPVSQAEYDLQHAAFIRSFESQKQALFPSKNGSEPFSIYAQKIQKEQYQELVILLGKDYFAQHADLRIKTAVGFILFERVER
jgi:6-phosphogluconolactonase/glucosamine-6-phosphate isomerase/deaminase